jgi:hypothetical protein
MSRTVVALLGIAVLVWFAEWLSVRAAGHLDLRLLPAHSRRRAQWLRAHSTRIQLGCGAAAVGLLAVQAALSLS